MNIDYLLLSRVNERLPVYVPFVGKSERYQLEASTKKRNGRATWLVAVDGKCPAECDSLIINSVCFMCFSFEEISKCFVNIHHLQIRARNHNKTCVVLGSR